MTNKVVNGRVVDDKKSCQRSNEYAITKSVKKHRSRMGINQTELGKLAGVSRQTISLIERGDYSPSVALALKLAKICQVTVEDIFTYTEDGEDE